MRKIFSEDELAQYIDKMFWRFYDATIIFPMKKILAIEKKFVQVQKRRGKKYREALKSIDRK